MLRTILPDDMKNVERRMMEATGTPALTLMERAAGHVANAVLPYLRHGNGRLVAVCGAGNNGGDGLAATRLLLQALPSLRVTIWQLPGEPSLETAAQWERLSPWKSRLQTVLLDADNVAEVPQMPRGTLCVLDAMYGTGLNRALAGVARAVVETLNASGVPVVAVDIPSGVDGATGRVLTDESGGVAVCAAQTVTFHRPKSGLFLADGLDTCGQVTVGEIGIAPEWDTAPGQWVLHQGDRLLPPRRRNTHKGDYGRVLALIGSTGMAGAAAICATAALRAGAGLVTVACPASILAVVQTLCPCATCLPLPELDAAQAWERMLPALDWADALVAGCGMGQDPWAAELIRRLTGWLQAHPMPAVLDADALNLLAADTWAITQEKPAAETSTGETCVEETPAGETDISSIPAQMEGNQSSQAWAETLEEGTPACETHERVNTSERKHLPACVVLTPHVGEAARLLRQSVTWTKNHQVEASRGIMRQYGASVVLKSASSVIIAKDGEAINLFGTPAMAKGGSGDALAGVLGALLAAQKTMELSGVRLLQSACALHGLAGMVAAERCGTRGMLATDLCDALGLVPDVITRAVVLGAALSQEEREIGAGRNPQPNPACKADASEEGWLYHLQEGRENAAPEKATQTSYQECAQLMELPDGMQRIRCDLGRRVRVTVDRPLGSRHPEHHSLIYKVNYGYVADVLAADNEWQDAYVLGVSEPLEAFEGEVAAIIHRLNDVEDKWVVTAPDVRLSEADVREQTHFIEGFFQSVVLLR